MDPKQPMQVDWLKSGAVSLVHLGWSIIIGAVISLSGYFVASSLLPAVVASPDMARAYAMLVGLAGSLISGVVCARLFPPKREVVEQGADPFWREEVLEQLVAETGALGSMADLPPEAIQELKELGLYELFASHQNMNAEQMAAEEQARHEQVLRHEAPHS
jgi:hypothetical protein